MRVRNAGQNRPCQTAEASKRGNARAIILIFKSKIFFNVVDQKVAWSGGPLRTRDDSQTYRNADASWRTKFALYLLNHSA